MVSGVLYFISSKMHAFHIVASLKSDVYIMCYSLVGTAYSFFFFQSFIKGRKRKRLCRSVWAEQSKSETRSTPLSRETRRENTVTSAAYSYYMRVSKRWQFRFDQVFLFPVAKLLLFFRM